MNPSGLGAFASLCLLVSGAAPPAEILADLDGDGVAETARVFARGKKVRLEVRDRGGKRSAAETVPSPGSRDPGLSVASGPLGSAGALLEVAAAAQGRECRSVWRYRNGELHRLDVRAQAAVLPDCAASGTWSYRWDRTSEDRPAVYVRERTRPTEGGPHRETEVFAFTGFALALDPARSRSEIRGVAIPVWFDAVLYHRQAVQSLSTRFDLGPVRSLPRLRIVTDRSRGMFSLRFSDSEGETAIPVVGLEKGKEKNLVELRAGAGDTKAEVSLELANGDIPTEARVTGIGPRFDHIYVPVSRLQEGAMRVFANAEEEIVSEGLAGPWANERGERYDVLALPGSGGRIRFGEREAVVKIDAAPAGTDVLLAPADPSAPAFALDLLGPNTLDRVPVRCVSAGEGPLRCETAGPRERLRRIGARLNLR